MLVVCNMFFDPDFVACYVISERAQPYKYVISVEHDLVRKLGSILKYYNLPFKQLK